MPNNNCMYNFHKKWFGFMQNFDFSEFFQLKCNDSFYAHIDRTFSTEGKGEFTWCFSLCSISVYIVLVASALNSADAALILTLRQKCARMRCRCSDCWIRSRISRMEKISLHPMHGSNGTQRVCICCERMRINCGKRAWTIDYVWMFHEWMNAEYPNIRW